MQNEPWVWLEVGDAGTSGAGAVPLMVGTVDGTAKNKKQKKQKQVCSTAHI